jgi:tetratricopeptide (TPR) repeat protein
MNFLGYPSGQSERPTQWAKRKLFDPPEAERRRRRVLSATVAPKGLRKGTSVSDSVSKPTDGSESSCKQVKRSFAKVSMLSTESFFLMDWLNRLSIAAIAALALIATGMVVNQEIGEKRHNTSRAMANTGNDSYAQQVERDKIIYQDVTSNMKQGLYDEAMAKLKSVMEKHPEKPLSYVYLAQLNLKEGKLGESIHNYRRAVDMEPDFVDKRTAMFIGDEISERVREGMEKFNREKGLRPNDEEVRRTLKDVYYLQRRLAGGCE